MDRMEGDTAGAGSHCGEEGSASGERRVCARTSVNVSVLLRVCIDTH